MQQTKQRKKKKNWRSWKKVKVACARALSSRYWVNIVKHTYYFVVVFFLFLQQTQFTPGVQTNERVGVALCGKHKQILQHYHLVFVRVYYCSQQLIQLLYACVCVCGFLVCLNGLEDIILAILRNMGGWISSIFEKVK